MLHHKAVVCCDVWLALHTIDDDTLGLGTWRRTQLDEGWETCTTHTCDTSHLDAVDNLFGSELGMRCYRLQLFRTVDTLLPLVAFYIDDNTRLAVTCSVDRLVYLEHSSRNRTVDRSTDKTTSLSKQSTYLHLVALGNNRLCRSTDVRTKRENGLLRKGCHLSSHLGCNLILFWVNTTYSKCSQFHACSSFFTGKLTFTRAPVGHSSTHLVHMRHLLKST